MENSITSQAINQMSAEQIQLGSMGDVQHSFGNSSTNIEANHTLLQALDEEKASELIPVTVYLTVLIFTGLLGNSFVLYIYYSKFKKTPSNYFVIWLAVLDLLSCILAMPFDIIDTRRPYTFDYPQACKGIRFIQSATLLTPAMTIIVIAFDRHDKVFRPFKRMSVTRAKVINVVCLLIAVVLALPAIFVFGRNVTPTRVIGIQGVTCSVDESVRGQIFPYVYYGVLFLVFIVTVIMIAVLYGRLWREIRNRSNRKRGTIRQSTNSKNTGEGSESHELEETSGSMSPPKKYYYYTTKLEAPGQTKISRCGSEKSSNDLQPSPKRSVKPYGSAGKTTKIVFCVSLAFVISFLPYLIAKVVQIVVADVDDFPSVAAEIIYNIATRSFFINNAVNPFIYIYLNPAFRRECLLVWRTLCCKCRPS